MSSTSSQNSTNNCDRQKHDYRIVHKPFDTGEINIFSPFKGKIDRQRQTDTKLALNDELATDTLTSPQLEWGSDLFFNVWSIGAIAILLLTNVMALGVIKMRNAEITAPVETPTPTIGNSDLTAKEFMPLDLSTVSNLTTAEEQPKKTEEPNIVPDSLIPPAFVPFDNNMLSQNNQYYYVLAQYTGNSSLELAREKVTNISLVHLPQGMFIYLGAFVEKQPASEFILKLQQEKIEAKIYPFD